MNHYKWTHFKCPLCGFCSDREEEEKKEEAELIAIALIKMTINED